MSPTMPAPATRQTRPPQEPRGHRLWFANSTDTTSCSSRASRVATSFTSTRTSDDSAHSPDRVPTSCSVVRKPGGQMGGVDPQRCEDRPLDIESSVSGRRRRQYWGQSRRPTADCRGLRRTATRTFDLQRISERLVAYCCERCPGSHRIVPRSAPSGLICPVSDLNGRPSNRSLAAFLVATRFAASGRELR
jgi:hypothetical protein